MSKTNYTPVEIEVLLHYYYMPSLHPNHNAPSVYKATIMWQMSGHLTQAGEGKYWTTTALGEDLVAKICNVSVEKKGEESIVNEQKMRELEFKRGVVRDRITILELEIYQHRRMGTSEKSSTTLESRLQEQRELMARLTDESEKLFAEKQEPVKVVDPAIEKEYNYPAKLVDWFITKISPTRSPQRIRQMRPEHVFKEILEHEGIIGYDTRILSWLRDLGLVSIDPSLPTHSEMCEVLDEAWDLVRAHHNVSKPIVSGHPCPHCTNGSDESPTVKKILDIIRTYKRVK